MAAAIGAGLPVAEPIGSMIVDIGGGTTEVGVDLAPGSRLLPLSARRSATAWTMPSPLTFRRNYNLLIGEGTAERVKLRSGRRFDRATERGDNSRPWARRQPGMPGEIILSQAEVAEALSEPVNQIIEVVRLGSRKYRAGTGGRCHRSGNNTHWRRISAARLRHHPPGFDRAAGDDCRRPDELRRAWCWTDARRQGAPRRADGRLEVNFVVMRAGHDEPPSARRGAAGSRDGLHHRIPMLWSACARASPARRDSR